MLNSYDLNINTNFTEKNKKYEIIIIYVKELCHLMKLDEKYVRIYGGFVRNIISQNDSFIKFS